MIKDFIRKLLKTLHLDLTKNQRYDRATGQIIQKVVVPGSNCVDVGCHKGEMLDIMLNYSPEGKHFAFEPIPEYFLRLQEKYQEKCAIFQLALSDSKGETTFNYVKNAPAFSGIKKRKYAVKNPEIEEITVQVDLLDSIVGNEVKIDFIKIDVEGAEFGVLKGAQKLLKRCKPVVVFEFGLGASDFYGTKPEEIYDFLNICGLNISTLNAWLKHENPLKKNELKKIYEENREYYFIAHP